MWVHFGTNQVQVDVLHNKEYPKAKIPENDPHYFLIFIFLYDP